MLLVAAAASGLHAAAQNLTAEAADESERWRARRCPFFSRHRPPAGHPASPVPTPPTFLHCPPRAAAALLSLRRAITNWGAFAAALGLQGWDAGTPACQWGGVACTEQGLVLSL